MTDASGDSVQWSLRRAFVRLLLVGGLLPGILFGLLVLWNLFDQQRERVLDRLVTSTRLSAITFDDFLEGQLAGVALAAEHASPQPASWATELRALRRHHPALLTALATDARGMVLHAEPASRLPSGSSTVADRSYFIGTRDSGGPYSSDAFVGRRLGSDPLVAVAAPIRDARGRFAGVVQGAIRVDTFSDLRARIIQGHHLHLLLADRSGRVVYAAPELGLAFLQPVPAGLLQGEIPGIGSASTTTRLSGLARNGGDVLAGRSRLSNGWTVILVMDARELWWPVLRDALSMLALVVLVTIGVVAAVWWQGRLLTGGLQRLLETLRGFALGGQLDFGRVQRMPRELQPLACAISDLSSRLNVSYDDLRKAMSRQSELAASLREVVDAREQEIAQRTHELQRAMAELDRLSRTDALTGCLNYRGFSATLLTETEAAQATGVPLAVLAMDVDHFKAYNDRYGHQRGDAALKQFAGIVMGALYGTSDRIARQGGEEFLVFLPDVDAERARAVGERILAALRAAAIPHAATPAGMLTVSIGVATLYPGDSADDLLRRADASLYRAKEQGRNRIVG